MIYLNNAASAWPKAPGVIEAVAECLAGMPEHPGRSVRVEMDALQECRTRLARMLGADQPERIVLTPSATHALNLAILGVGLKPGETVVTSVAEHNSMLRPLARLEDALGLRLKLVGMAANGFLDVDAFEEALRGSPRLVALSHASNVTGLTQPVAAMFARARQAGALTLLDASQSLGHVPVNTSELNADLIAFTGHKGLRGPPGTGGLWVSPGVELEQIVVGGTGFRSDLRRHPAEMPTRLEAGTPNIPALAGLAAALRWRRNKARISCARTERAEQMRTGLRNIPRLRLFGDSADAPAIGIFSFRVEGWRSKKQAMRWPRVLGLSAAPACTAPL